MAVGIVGSVFVIAVFWISSSGGGTLDNAMAVFLGIALSTAVLAYIFTIPATITLRRKFPDMHRPFIVPGGKSVCGSASSSPRPASSSPASRSSGPA